MARIFLERRDLPPPDDDLRRVLDSLADPARSDAPAADCQVLLDVVETDASVEIVIDLPGVAAADISLVFVRNTLVISGRKTACACDDRGAAFHLAERAFGRFARGVRLTGAFDAGRADARLTAGELRVTLPRLDDRRGRRLRIPVQEA